jgi:MSHA biogenesis protein MshI
VRWKIKDLLDMKVEDAGIDVFQVPDDAYRGRTNMVYVVATLKSRIESIVEMVSSSGLELAVIDIPELAMKNISSQFMEDDNGIAFLDLRKTGSTMNLTRDGDLYLTRRINTQLDPDVMQSPQWEELKDRLVLEIQRSLDYFESQMGQGQITQIIIARRQHDTTGMTEALNEALTARVSALDLSLHIESEANLSPEMQQTALTAIGATLRLGKKARQARKEKVAA